MRLERKFMSLNYKLRRNLASYRVTTLPDSLIEEDLRAAYKYFAVISAK